MSVAATILQLASARGNDKTICPSEVARTMWPSEWRKHMEEVRQAAFTLRDKGQVLILQKGETITGNTVKGPIRIQIV